MWAGLYAGDAEDIRREEDALDWRIRMAQADDSYLNDEEQEAKREAEMECEFGPRWWMRAHP